MTALALNDTVTVEADWSSRHGQTGVVTAVLKPRWLWGDEYSVAFDDGRVMDFASFELLVFVPED